MQTKKFKKFIKAEDKRLRKKYPIGGEDKHILGRMVKITEEVGELADEVLGFNSLQRKQKLDKRNKEELFHEFADVIITVYLLAETMKVDIGEALEKTIKKIEERHKK